MWERSLHGIRAARPLTPNVEERRLHIEIDGRVGLAVGEEERKLAALVVLQQRWTVTALFGSRAPNPRHALQDRQQVLPQARLSQSASAQLHLPPTQARSTCLNQLVQLEVLAGAALLLVRVHLLA